MTAGKTFDAATRPCHDGSMALFMSRFVSHWSEELSRKPVTWRARQYSNLRPAVWKIADDLHR